MLHLLANMSECQIIHGILREFGTRSNERNQIIVRNALNKRPNNSKTSISQHRNDTCSICYSLYKYQEGIISTI